MRLPDSRPRGRGRRGNNIIEFTFLVPWYIFLFVGAFDFGFFSYSLIAAQVAASEAAMYCSNSSATASDTATACVYALAPSSGTCRLVGYHTSTCGTNSGLPPLRPWRLRPHPLRVPTATPPPVSPSLYLTPQLVPIPGVFPGDSPRPQTVADEAEELR